MGGCCCSGNQKVKDTNAFHKIHDDDKEVVDVSDEDANSSFECPICLGTSQKRLQATPCMHVFHAKCLRDWMKRKPECPVCRLKLVD